MVRAAGNAPACSCSRSKRLTFRLRSDKLPSALNSVSGHYFNRASGGRVLTPAGRPTSTEENGLPGRSLGEGWSSIRVLRPVFLLGRQACISQHLCSENRNWSPVRELHSPGRFCRPLPGLLGQRDKKGSSPINQDCSGVIWPFFWKSMYSRAFPEDANWRRVASSSSRSRAGWLV